MRYAVLDGNEQFKLIDGDMLHVKRNPVIRVAYVGVCGTDMSYWRHGDEYKGMIIGHEYSGIIEEPGITGLFKKGDHVIGYTQNVAQEPCGHCSQCQQGNLDQCINRKVKTWKGGEYAHPGAYSEYTTWFPQSIYKIPNGVDLSEAALAEPFTVGLHAINIAEMQVGDKVLILGGGIIGLAVAEWARLRGASEITITEMNTTKIEKLKCLDIADHVLNAGDDNVEENLMEVSHGGYDVVFDCVGAASAINTGIKALKNEFFKKFISIALPYRMISIDYTSIVLHETILRGSKGHLYEEFKTVAQALCNGDLKLKKYISRVIEFNDVQKGFEELKASAGIEIKAVIKVHGD